MALPNFFDKSVLAASHILQAFDIVTFKEKLKEHCVGLIFDEAAVQSPEGKATLQFATNLLARLYPRIALVDLSESSLESKLELDVLAESINPDVEINEDLNVITTCLVVGETEIEAEVPTLYLGSDRWVVQLSQEGPPGSGFSENPFGAGAAACFGAANAFRVTFGDQLPRGDLDEEFAFSLLDYLPGKEQPLNPDVEDVDLGESYLVGLGAIGNGVVWALSQLPGLHGRLHLIDGECLELSNLQRYVLTRQGDVGKEKTLFAASFFESTQVEAVPHQQHWGPYVESRDNHRFDRVAVCVDTPQDRIAVQSTLPKRTLNAWTQPEDLGVSRHSFIDEQACLACLYMPDGDRKSEAEKIAEAVGLEQEERQQKLVRKLLYSNEPMSRQHLELIAQRKGAALEQLLRFEGAPLRVFYSEAVCGGILLDLSGDSGAAEMVETPMAFQSALAGLMLAAEMISDAGELREEKAAPVTKIDLRRSLGDRLLEPAAAHESDRCICQDEDYMQAYRRKYINNSQ